MSSDWRIFRQSNQSLLKEFVMMRLLLNSTVIALLSGFSANAADMSYPVTNPQETTAVEFGSGWYLRGDIGYNLSGKQSRGSDFIPMIGNHVVTDYQDAVSFRAGFGFQLNPSFRLEMNLENTLESEFANTVEIGYSGSVGYSYDTTVGTGPTAVTTTHNDVAFFDAYGNHLGSRDGGTYTGPNGPIIGQQTITASYSSQNFMVNGYYDMPQFGRFTPYVGAGAGLARITYSEKRENSDCADSGGYQCAGGQVSSAEVDYTKTSWKPAYSISVGTAYALNENLSLDVGYSFLSVAGGDTINYSDGAAIDENGFSTHQVRAGLRYQIW